MSIIRINVTKRSIDWIAVIRPTNNWWVCSTGYILKSIWCKILGISIHGIWKTIFSPTLIHIWEYLCWTILLCDVSISFSIVYFKISNSSWEDSTLSTWINCQYGGVRIITKSAISYNDFSNLTIFNHRTERCTSSTICINGTNFRYWEILRTSSHNLNFNYSTITDDWV